MKKFIRISVLTAAICLMCTAFAFAADYAAPTGLQQTKDSYNSATFTWDKVLNANYYAIQISNTGTDFKDDGDAFDTTSSITEWINNLNSGASYYVRVAACDRVYQDGKYYYDPGKWSAPIEIVTAPQQPEDKVIQTRATTSSVTISYPKVPGATQYTVYSKDATTNGTSWIETKPEKGLTKTITGLGADKRYDIKVSAQRESTAGYITTYDNSRYLKGYKDAKTVSGKVSGLKVEYAWANIEKMSFKWNKKENADGYQLEFYDFKTKKAVKKNINNGYSSSSDSYELNPKTFYKVRIRSFVTMGNDVKKYSAWSGYNYVQLQQLPKLSQSGSKIKVKWGKVAGATKYTVYVAKSYNGTYKKCGTTTKTSFTIGKYGKAKTKKGNSYYVKVVAEKKVGSKTYKGTSKECQNIYLSKN